MIKFTEISTYDPFTGKIATRSALDNASMIYSLNGPHSLDTIKGMPSAFPTDNLNVTYTDFNKIASLSEGNKLYTLTYGVDDQRRKSVYQVNGLTQQTRYYLGDYEEAIDASGNVRKIHYLSGGAVLIRNNGQDSLLYGYADYLGSLTTLTDANGNVLERFAYDPWGKRRNPSDWTQVDMASTRRVNRGYTMHEHLDAFQIINMNGRVYDPLTAQFFSPDPFVQAPGNWLNYNRYSYCYNNPFRYTDPDGEFVLEAIILGAVFGGYIGGMQADMQGGNYWEGFGKGALIGSIAGVGGSLAGQVVAGSITFGGFFGGAISGAASGAVGGFISGAGNSWISGANFGDGLNAGLMGAGIGTLTGGLIGGLTRGIADYRNGYNFWDGSAVNEYIVGTAEYERIANGYKSHCRSNDEYLQLRMQDEYGVKEGDFKIQKITTKAPLRYGLTTDGIYVNLETKCMVGGYIKHFSTGHTNFHISPYYTNAETFAFRAVAGHELIHAYHYYTLPKVNSVYTERVAYKYTHDILLLNGYPSSALSTMNTALFNSKGQFWGPYPAEYQIPSIFKLY